MKQQSRSYRTWRWALLGAAIVLPIAGGLVGVKMQQFNAMSAAAASFTAPPERVNAVTVRAVVWQPRVSAVGTVKAFQGTTVSTEADGVVREILFEAGSRVAAGDILVQLDAEVEQAQLRSAEASAELAQSSYERAQELKSERYLSDADLDQAQANQKQARAQLDDIRALTARKTVRAPFSGRLGIRQISKGQYLAKGSGVVSLQSLDSVHVDFSLPQQRLGDLAEGLTVVVASDAYPDESFNGVITAINPEVDDVTRNVRVQATVPNPDERLRPGMFVTMNLILAQHEEVLIIPTTAVQHAPFGDSVFVIEESESNEGGSPQLVVRQQVVQLGARRGDFVTVTSGVEGGERIVSTGPFKLRPGTPVVIDNSLAPDFTLTPTPGNS